MTAEPLHRSVWTRARWIVVAPHPDDETLGAGALIAQTAKAGRLAAVVYLTDGAGSHPAGTHGLAAARRAEARRAVRRLTGIDPAIVRISWQDAHPHAPGSPRFARDAGRLGAALRRARVDAIAVTGSRESHCDHVAAYILAEAAARLARRRVALFTYDVWTDGVAGGGRRTRTRPMRTGRRRHALRAHRSQLTPAFGAGFRLPRERMRMPAHDVLTMARRA